MVENINNEETLFKDHHLLEIISANMGVIAFAAATAFISNWGFYFYENLTIAGTAAITIGYLIYGIWNAINDPIFGYLSDKTYRFTRRWGRRFPWIIFGTIPFAVSTWLIFAVPSGASRPVVIAWMIISLLLYETLYTMIQTSSGALMPDKFRSEKDRRRLVTINQVLWFVGTLAGIFLPGVFFFGAETATQPILMRVAALVSIVSLVGMVTMIPGVREPPELIERTLRLDAEKTDKISFLRLFIHLLKNRNFLGYFFATVGMMILQQMTIVSIPYIVKYISGMPDTMAIVIQFAYVGAAVISVPLWVALMKRSSYKKLYTYAFLIVPIALLPFLIVSNFYIFVGLALLIGIGVGGMSMLGARMYWSVIDQACVEIGERREGAYAGVFTFMQRIGPIIATSMIGAIHLWTNFVEGADTQSAPAILGIRLGVSIVPAVFALLGFIIFKFLFKLDPEAAQQNLEKMKEMGL